jgi:hypothetical protein
MPLIDDDLLFDNDFEDDTGATWSLDELERSADLGLLRSAWAAGHDGEQ